MPPQTYNVVRELATTPAAKVLVVEGAKDKKLRVLKRIAAFEGKEKKGAPPKIQSAIQETRMMFFLRHRHVIELQDFFVKDDFFNVVMEFCEKGDLSKQIVDRIERREYFHQDQILMYFTQVCEALAFAHDMDIIHRDIKPQNIFVATDTCVKVGDFGVGKVLQTADELVEGNRAGTRAYMAPEVYNKEKYTNKADVWSVGVVLFEMLSLVIPHVGFSQNFEFDKIPTAYHPVFRSLCEKMLQIDPNLRPSIRDCLSEIAAAGVVPAFMQRSTLAQPGEKRAGVGLVFEPDYYGNLHVVDIAEGGAAGQSGLVKVGDVLTEVNGVTCDKTSLAASTEMILGPPGSLVNMSFSRGGVLGAPNAETVRVSLVRSEPAKPATEAPAPAANNSNHPPPPLPNNDRRQSAGTGLPPPAPAATNALAADKRSGSSGGLKKWVKGVFKSKEGGSTSGHHTTQEDSAIGGATASTSSMHPNQDIPSASSTANNYPPAAAAASAAPPPPSNLVPSANGLPNTQAPLSWPSNNNNNSNPASQPYSIPQQQQPVSTGLPLFSSSSSNPSSYPPPQASSSASYSVPLSLEQQQLHQQRQMSALDQQYPSDRQQPQQQQQPPPPQQYYGHDPPSPTSLAYEDGGDYYSNAQSQWIASPAPQTRGGGGGGGNNYNNGPDRYYQPDYDSPRHSNGRYDRHDGYNPDPRSSTNSNGYYGGGPDRTATAIGRTSSGRDYGDYRDGAPSRGGGGGDDWAGGGYGRGDSYGDSQPTRSGRSSFAPPGQSTASRMLFDDPHDRNSGNYDRHSSWRDDGNGYDGRGSDMGRRQQQQQPDAYGGAPRESFSWDDRQRESGRYNNNNNNNMNQGGSYGDSPESSNSFDNHVGVGIRITPDMSGAVYVIELEEGGPAQQSGMVAVGDCLHDVDGIDVYKQPVALINNLINGPPGSDVVIGLKKFMAKNLSFVRLRRGVGRPVSFDTSHSNYVGQM